MEEMDGARQELLTRVSEEFPPSEPPVEVVSLLARELHASAGDIEAALDGLPWHEVPRRVLEDQAKNILALSPESFQHYLPAFMKSAVVDPAGDSATYVMYALVPLANFDQYMAGTCMLFSPEQANLIADFLENLASEPTFEVLAHEVPVAVDLWRRRASG
jgi:hypothetical protein